MHRLDAGHSDYKLMCKACGTGWPEAANQCWVCPGKEFVPFQAPSATYEADGVTYNLLIVEGKPTWIQQRDGGSLGAAGPGGTRAQADRNLVDGAILGRAPPKTDEVVHHIGGRCRRGRLGLIQHQAGRHSRLACADFLGLLAGHFHLLRGECLVLNQLEGSCRSRRGGHCLFGVGSEVIPLIFFTKLGSENPRAKLEPKWPGPLWSSISNTVHVSTCVSTLTKSPQD